MAAHAIAFIKALWLTKVDFLGWSIGGVIAQENIPQAGDLVRRLILVGTEPRGADMSTSKIPEVFAGVYDPPEHIWFASHFSASASSRAAGLAFLERKHARKDRDPELSKEARGPAWSAQPSGFLNLGSEVQVLSGTPFSAQFAMYRLARE
jgi:pimeloyl-ACP methyl ester carboxylesterase